MKTTINGFINFRLETYKGESKFQFHACTMEEYGYIAVMPFSLEVDIPDEFDPRAKMVEVLQKKKREAMADFQKRITDIDAQISKYLALEAA